jgi:hypothetical protein
MIAIFRILPEYEEKGRLIRNEIVPIKTVDFKGIVNIPNYKFIIYFSKGYPLRFE